jgi:RNA polymerase sigma-70 factor (ECF subfamily)
MTIAEYNRSVERFSDNVYRFVLKSLRDTEAAKDIVQESFLRLWENRQAVIAGKEKSYLFTVAYRLSIDHIRSLGRYTGNSLPENRSWGGDMGYDNLNDVLSLALDALNEVQRNLILLRDYEGYSYLEIGGMTGLSESQVKVYLFRARNLLKERIGPLEKIL